MATELQNQTKHPLGPIAGTYGHPIHPLLVTVPIGAWLASFVFDLASHAHDGPDAFVRGALWLVGIGIIGGLVAAIFGLLDFLRIPRGTRAFATGLVHAVLNVAVVALFAVSLAVRWGHRYDDAVPIEVIVLSAVALGMLSASGWLGGRLVYRYGVRVVDEATQAEGFEPPQRPLPGSGLLGHRPSQGT